MMTETRTNIIERINAMMKTEINVHSVKKEDGVQVDTFDHEGSISLYDDYILTLETTNKKNGEMDFFLHFDMKEDAELESKIRPFLDFLKSNGSGESGSICRSCFKEPLRVLLCCTGGVTSSHIANMINDKADELMIDLKAEGSPWFEMKEKAEQADIILLAPQISYLEKKLKAQYGEKVSCIPAMDFATFNSKGIIHTIMKKAKERKRSRIERSFSFFDSLAVLAAAREEKQEACLPCCC